MYSSIIKSYLENTSHIISLMKMVAVNQPRFHTLVRYSMVCLGTRPVVVQLKTDLKAITMSIEWSMLYRLHLCVGYVLTHLLATLWGSYKCVGSEVGLVLRLFDCSKYMQSIGFCVR